MPEGVDRKLAPTVQLRCNKAQRQMKRNRARLFCLNATRPASHAIVERGTVMMVMG
jgi:hypothetical protein